LSIAEDSLNRLVEKWTAIERCTEPADRAQAEATIVGMYEETGLGPSPNMHWVASPWEGMEMAAYIKQRDYRVGTAVWRFAVDAILRYPEKANTRNVLGLSESAVQSAIASFPGGITELVRREVQKDQPMHKSGVVGRARAGSLDASEALRAEMYEMQGVDIGGMKWLKLMAEYCGFWWIFKGDAVLCERPTAVCFETPTPRNDEERQLAARGRLRRRLHSGAGPAIGWSDGTGIYAWRGVLVAENVITKPNEMDPQAIITTPNMEQRRVMMERYGYDRLFSKLAHKVLDEDVDGGGQKRKLLRIQVSGDEDLVVVKVSCPSTGSVYFLRVPPDTRKCAQGIAWTWGIASIKDYKPLKET